MECFAIISKTRYLLLLIRRENQKEENKRGHAHTKRKKRERKESLPSFSYSAPVRIRRADGSLFFFFGAYIFLFIFFPLVFFFFLFFFRCAVPPPVRGRPRLMMSSAGWVSIAGRPLDQLLAGSRRFADRVKLNENQPPNPPAPPLCPLSPPHTRSQTHRHTQTPTHACRSCWSIRVAAKKDERTPKKKDCHWSQRFKGGSVGLGPMASLDGCRFIGFLIFFLNRTGFIFCEEVSRN